MGKGIRLLLAIVAGCVGLVVAYLAASVAYVVVLVAMDLGARKDAGDLVQRVPVGASVEQVERLVGRPPDRRTGFAVPWDGNLAAMPMDVAVRGRFTHQWVVKRGRLIVQFDHHAVIHAYGVAEPPFFTDTPVGSALMNFFGWWRPAD